MKQLSAAKLRAEYKQFLDIEAGAAELDRDLAATKTEVEAFLESIDPMDKAALKQATEIVAVKQTYIGLLPRKIEKLKADLEPALDRLSIECERFDRALLEVAGEIRTEETQRLAKIIPETLLAGSRDPSHTRLFFASQAPLFSVPCGFIISEMRYDHAATFCTRSEKNFPNQRNTVIKAAEDLLALFDAWEKNGRSFVAKSMQQFLK